MSMKFSLVENIKNYVNHYREALHWEFEAQKKAEINNVLAF